MNTVEKVISALEKRYKAKEEERAKAHDTAAGYLQLEKKLDNELEMIRTTINYLNNHCINTLKVE